jgi:hypothetical protein
MLTISKEQQKFIDLFLLDTYHSFSDEEQIEFDENEDLGESKIIERQLESFHKLRSSEDLHYLMKSWNWDDGNNIPSLVLSHPKCDYGTALMIYWMCDPDYYLEREAKNNIPDFQQEDFELLKMIENRLLSNDFELERIQFDPASYASAREFENPLIPDKLKEKSNGEEFENLIAFSLS